MLPVKFYGKKVLAVFRCGSYLHEVQSENSDKDYTVILKNYKDIRVEKRDKVDFFLFGLEPFKRATRFDNRILDYFLLWMDNTLVARENLEYLDESFKDEFDEIINIDWGKYLTTWLRTNIQYFTSCLEGLINEKSLYNLYRIRSLIKHYQATGRFEYYLSEEDKELIIDYKNRQENLEKHRASFKEILLYLNKFLDKEE
jgi:hypothetical protein